MPLPSPLIGKSHDLLDETPVFAETIVPVEVLMDYLKAGESLDAFLDDFPSVSRDHAVAVLELAKSYLLTLAADR